MAFFRKNEEQKPAVAQEILDLREAVAKAGLPEHVSPVVEKELERLEKTDPAAAEYSIGLGYIDYLVGLPWQKYSSDNLDMARAEQILEVRHHGLPHVKERVLEYLAVRVLRSTAQIQGLGCR